MKSVEAMNKALKQNDVDRALAHLAELARQHGVTKLATETGLTRAAIYKCLREGGNPEFRTVTSLLEAMKLRFSVMG